MNLRYFGYVVRDNKQQNAFIYNINLIMKAYCESNNSLLKSGFLHNGENIYLIKIEEHQNLYYLIKTNNNDIIKQVNQKSFSVGDIQDKLTADEKIGFASYVYFCNRTNILAIANSIGSPRIDTLCQYINVLFSKAGVGTYEIEASALTKNSEKKDLLKMEVVNSIFIDVDANKGVGKLIKDYLFSNDQSGIGNFKITVESTTGNMKDAFSGLMTSFTDSQGVVNNVNDSGIEKIGAKAKLDALRGQLLDYWLDNENGLSDTLNPKAKRKSLMEQIEEKFDGNLSKDSYYKSFVEQKCVVVEANSNLDIFKDKKAFDIKNTAYETQIENNTENVVDLNVRASGE
ncbi:hypothetical protein [Yersinia aldovae]|uniref:37-kD nucleoid-associated bacterial protein n=1 Tax=Yersinia aldovae TaxID=29483 RepID=A0ABM9SN61_YERAL|nr:hypothetical protein [Yersinia aldovae]CNK41455.1 Uncharacterised protein [Yersinia aldovae]